MTKKILMVCMGNICRSPIAEAVMAKIIQQNKAAAATDEWFIDSAALVGYHSGSLPDERALNVLKRHGITYDKEARVIKTEDFQEFDYIVFGMDPGNVAELKRRAPVGAKAQILLLGDYGLKDDEKIIHDPYYFLGEEPFEIVYQQCQQACEAFLQTLL
ncbi:LOW QUALITY PROTEIN: low molecular weight phosphotyrosine protein phosphatase 2-like [Lucilia sericata]|uniref:LOW QUALITY PROTEIN: low molecular weight phosphotyrosine protein phosphatase 2-like n=1 Tax=Lucilia sericata TaxID=13632 RepID=UPI0018A812C8|nr:LOW QUALITY PROTEIN: low molecular weight phosphotyrosine protein phosphatase 2-like [Lucilia sericata]